MAEAPDAAGHPVVVVGGGVMGFTCALRLLQTGYRDVTIVAKTFTPVPSKSSPAVFRPAWMGATPPERTIRWGKESGKEFARLFRLGHETGITATTHVEFFKAAAGPEAAVPDPALREVMAGYRDATQLELDTFSPDAAGGWVYSTFMVEGLRYLKYLEEQARPLGLRVIQMEVQGPAQSVTWCQHALSVAERPNCRVLVNATGLNGGPDTHPIRGDLVLVKAPQVRVAIGEYMPADLTRPTYIYPRRDHVVLGGSYLEGDGDKDDRPEMTSDVIERCAAFMPELRHAPVIGVVPCIRPGRKAGVRLDCVQAGDFRVVNNYGHGGGGMGIAWGCAGEVVELVEAATNRVPSGASRL